MKKTVLKFGLISGAMLAAFMFATLPFMDSIGFDYGLVVGYTGMVLAFLLVFFGIRSYRDNAGGGHITFWRGLKVGLLIVLVASVCYVIAWEIVYFNFIPDFVEKYTNYMVEKERAAGASAEQIAQTIEKMNSMKSLLDNPFTHAALVFLEPLPVGLLMTLISAALLRRRPAPEVDGPERLEQSAA
ncbi:MAG TPA: DUF4199 domain-containing protein [Pyrinomonadaceae bacterium]|nr:DUF4199 domain-containing protein [Pyrinomonadaceae bacterium]